MYRASFTSALALLVCAVTPTAAQNPAARPNRDVSALAASWNGSHLEQRSGCRSEPTNGFHGTYGAYIVRVDTIAHTIGMDELGITGLTCNYFGPYRTDSPGGTTWSGSLSCSDGRAGTFESRGLRADGITMAMRLAIRLSGTETCTIDALISGAHL
jgi:hypothetical protein